MAYKNGNGKQSKILRLTSMFPTKGAKGKGYVGSISGRYLSKFLKKVAKPAGKKGDGAITFFFKKWAAGEKPVLSAAVGTAYKSAKKPTRRDRRRDDDRRGFASESERERREVR